ncbi:MAG: hypothetical protein ACRCSK_00325 [Fusobacteriaceae bacterium]
MKNINIVIEDHAQNSEPTIYNYLAEKIEDDFVVEYKYEYKNLEEGNSSGEIYFEKSGEILRVKKTSREFSYLLNIEKDISQVILKLLDNEIIFNLKNITKNFDDGIFLLKYDMHDDEGEFVSSASLKIYEKEM